MKLLCCADFHLGAGAEYGPRPGDRLADQREVLDRICERAVSEGVDAVLFAGDAFERRSPTPAELIVWRRFYGTLRVAGIDIIGVAGNHDVASADLPTGMEVVDACHRAPCVVEIGSFDAPVFVATLPWTPPARLVAARGGGDRDELHAEAAQLLLQTARELRAQIPHGRTSILLAHWSVSGAVTPSGADVGLFREVVLPLPDLLGLDFDFVVLGHIHEMQVLASNVVADFRSANGTDAMGTGPVGFYVGSPMVLNFGEAQGHHGVVLLDTEARSIRHVELDDRPFVTVDVDLLDPAIEAAGGLATDETDYIAAGVVERFPLTGAVVRIRYRATAEQARRVDHAALRGLVADAGASKLYAIQPEIVRSERARVAGVDENLSEREALIRWTEANGIGGPQEEALDSLTADYLEALA